MDNREEERGGMKVQLNVLVVANRAGLRQGIEQVIRRGNGINWHQAVGNESACFPHFADSLASAKSILHGTDATKFDLVIIERGLSGNADFQGFELYTEVRDSGVCPLTILLGFGNNLEPSWLENEPWCKVMMGQEEPLMEQLSRIISLMFGVPKTTSQPPRRSSAFPEAVV